MDAALRQVEAAQEARVVYEFQLPEEAIELADKYVKKSVGFVKLGMKEELAALELAKNDPAKAAYYMVVKSLVEVDGKRISKVDGEDELIVMNTDPVIRSLMVDAHGSISGPRKESQQAFLKSRRAKVG